MKVVKRIQLTADEVEKIIAERVASVLGEKAEDLTVRMKISYFAKEFNGAHVDIGYTQDEFPRD